jgi:pSer/pThr/pTyr-binding forkhead associated (FHA) protein
MLKIVSKDQRFDAIWVVDKQFLIGSGDGNQLILNDPSVSPQHARLIATSDGYLLKDSGSHQGTFVNGQAIQQCPVKAGDQLRLGDIQLTLEDPFETLVRIKSAANGWSLVACSSFLSGQEFPLVGKTPQQNELILGRGKDCDLVFPGTHLSRQHLSLRIFGDHLKLRDLNSANGSFINDKRIREGIAKPGDKIRLDVYTFKVLGPQGLTAPTPDRSADNAGNKQWVTRPTSIGNRDMPAPSHSMSWGFWLGLGLLLCVFAVAAYLLVL